MEDMGYSNRKTKLQLDLAWEYFKAKKFLHLSAVRLLLLTVNNI